MVGWRQACKVFEETGLDTYRSICLLSDQVPRLMVISLPSTVCVTRVHRQVIPPKTGEFCISFAAVKIKVGVSGLSERVIAAAKSAHMS